MVTRRRVIETPQVQVQSMDVGAGSAEDQIASFAFSTAEVLADKANKKYEMDFRNNAQEQINTAFDRNQNDPAQLQKELKAARSGLVRQAPLNLRDDFGVAFDQISRPFVNKATSNHGRILTEGLKESSLRNLDNARVAMTRISADLLSGDPVVVADATRASQAKITEMIGTVSQTDVNGAPLFGGKERFRLIKSLIDDTTFSSVREAYNGADDKVDFLNRLKSGDLTASIFLDEQGNFIEGSVKDNMAPRNYERVRNWIERDIAQREKEAQEVALYNQQLQVMESVKNGEYVLDPTSKQQRKMVDADWNTLSAQAASLSPDEQAKFAIDYVSQVGVVPSALESQASAFLANGAPDQRVMAAEIIEQIAENRPTVLNQFTERDRIIARQISENINAGIPLEQAVEFADSNIFERGTPEYKTRLQSFKDSQAKFSEGNFTRVFRNDPSEIPAGMIADYDTLHKKYYMDGGLTIEGSEKMAIETVTNNWGITNVGGEPRWMKHAPELRYDNGTDPKWINEQLVADVLEQGQMAEDLDDFTDSLFIEIAPEAVTERDPFYLVFTRDENGMISPLLDPNGSQQVFKPDYESSPAFKKLMKRYNNNKERAMVAAKRMRRQAVIEGNIQSIREGF